MKGVPPIIKIREWPCFIEANKVAPHNFQT